MSDNRGSNRTVTGRPGSAARGGSAAGAGNPAGSRNGNRSVTTGRPGSSRSNAMGRGNDRMAGGINGNIGSHGDMGRGGMNHGGMDRGHMGRGGEGMMMGHTPHHPHWGPGFHRPHPYGFRMHDLFDYHPFWWHGINYFIADGLYWRYINDMYVLCRPPYGVVIDVDVVNPDPIIVYNTVETTSEGTTVSPLAALAASLGLTQNVVPDGTKYYYEDGVFYLLGDDGKYQVIVPPAGALVSELPEDYSMISLGGNEYYLVDDTVYRLTVADGVSCFEVIGQRS